MISMDYPLSDRRILVTGGAGYIGHHLVKELHRENEVRVLDDLSTGKRHRLPPGVELIEGDIRDSESVLVAMDGVDLVYHLAAQADVSRSVGDPGDTFSINASGTLKVLSRAHLVDTPVIVTSSAPVYGEPSSVPIEEDDTLDPKRPYGQSKLRAERHVTRYAQEHSHPTAALRLFNVFGGDRHEDHADVVSTFIHQARTGGPITVHGDGSQRRDFVHIGDVIQALHRSVKTEMTGEVYNIGSGTSIAISTLAEAIRDAIDPSCSIEYTRRRPDDIHRSEASIERAQRAFGYQPTLRIEEWVSSQIPMNQPVS